MRQRATFGVLIVAVLVLLPTCAVSWAQTDSAPTAQVESPPTPIPSSNIASEAEAANFRLRRIRIDLDKAVQLSREKEQLAGLTASLERIRPALESDKSLHDEELVNFRQELARFNLRLKELQDRVDPRSRLLEERREELRRMESLWQATYQSLSGVELPGSSRDLVSSNQSQINDLSALLRDRQPALLAMQNQVSELRITVNDYRDRIGEALEKSRQQLFVLDSEPLWNAFQSAAGVKASFAELLRDSYVRRALPLIDYMKDNERRLVAHLLITLLLSWLLVVVSRGNRRWLKPTDANRDAEEVLRHPLAGALVISLLLSMSIYPNAPVTVYRLPLLLMVFPLARIVAAALSREERIAFYFLTGLYVLWRLDGLFSFSEFPLRIFILALACLGIFGAVWGAGVARKALHAGMGPWLQARFHLLRLGAFLLSGALIANIVGNVTLAVLLVAGCISSAYSAAAFFAGAITLESFLLPLFQAPLAQKSLAIREQSRQFRRRSCILIRFVALIAWIISTLVAFGIYGPIKTWLTAMLTRQWSFGQIAFSLGGILLFVITICVSFWAARFAAFIAEKDILSRMKLAKGIPATVSMLVRDFVLALGFILALAGAGVKWSQIALIAGAVGVGIGLGLQQLVASFIAGLILIFERPIRVGDVVEVNKVEGTVSRIGMRSSTIEAVNGSELICPNNRLISEDFINWTLSHQLRRVEVPVSVVHGSDSEMVLDILKKVALDHPEVLRKPEPVALFRSFGESSLNFELHFFTQQSRWIVLNSEVGVLMKKALREAGIELALPRRDINITKVNESSY